MRRFLLLPCLACILATIAACAPNPAPADRPSVATAPALTQFGSEEAFGRYQQRMVRDWEARTRKRPVLGSYPRQPEPPARGYPPPHGEPVDATSSSGVHEGGIVKATRDHLLILRHNRLHTVRIAAGALDTVASAPVFTVASASDNAAAGGTLFVAGDVVAATRYDARLLRVDVVLFRLDAAGGLARLGAYQIRCDGGEDRAPSVRMVDGRLVVYAPVGVWAGDPAGIARYLPAVRRPEPADGDTAWTPLADPARIYRPAGPMRADDGNTLHTLTVCDPSSGALDCRATVVYAPRHAAHHVSRTAAYAWTTQWRGHDDEGGVPDRSILYRIPLDGGAPTALGVRSRPHAFDETADGQLHVLVSAGRLPLDRVPAGSSLNPVALLRVPLSAFGDGSGAAGDDAYRALPNPGSTTLRSRFAGEWVVYGTARENGSYGSWEEGLAFAARRDGAGEAVPVPLAGGLVAFDGLGVGALVTTYTGDSLRYQPLRLDAGVELGAPFSRPANQPWDVPGHAVFHHAEEGDTGVLGVARSGYVYSPSVLFLRADAAGLRAAGEVGATVPPGTECPWCGGPYDFARPVFLRGRIFALVGGELVEAAMQGDRIRETRRVRIGPAARSR
jgi:hypothetical protein